MSIANLHTLSASAFTAKLKGLMTAIEGNEPLPYFDSAQPGLITIGIGFNIVLGNDSTWRTAA